MLTDKDIQKLLEVLATKEELRSVKEELLSNLSSKEDVDRILNAVDKYSKQITENSQEIQMLGSRVSRIKK